MHVYKHKMLVDQKKKHDITQFNSAPSAPNFLHNRLHMQWHNELRGQALCTHFRTHELTNTPYWLMSL